MILLLDAHTVLWAVTEPRMMPDATRSAIESPANEVIVSAASIWELEIKRTTGKLRFTVDLIQELESVGLGMLPITALDATNAARLPPYHRDPFDRMLVAQADRIGAVIVTRDRIFERYGAQVLPA